MKSDRFYRIDYSQDQEGNTFAPFPGSAPVFRKRIWVSRPVSAEPALSNDFLMLVASLIIGVPVNELPSLLFTKIEERPIVTNIILANKKVEEQLSDFADLLNEIGSDHPALNQLMAIHVGSELGELMQTMVQLQVVLRTKALQ